MIEIKPGTHSGSFKKISRGVGLGLLTLVGLIQLVPYGRSHGNPAARTEPVWNSSQTRMLVVRACYDCHSNQSVWPWYSHVAPVSWLIQHDVDEGRRELNFSEWDRPQREAAEAAESVQKSEMPPALYGLIHPHARLTPAERDALIRGLQASVGSTRAPPIPSP